MTRRTRTFCAARAGGDVGAILRRFNVPVPSSTLSEKHRKPRPGRVEETPQYYVSDLLRAIIGSESDTNGNGC